MPALIHRGMAIYSYALYYKDVSQPVQFYTVFQRI
jgi:hypothetical protein